MAMAKSWSVRGVSYAIGGKSLISDISLDVHPGQVVGILGPNGAGKSTLLRVAAGLFEATAGEVHLEGQTLAAMPRHEAARRIAFVPQDTHVEFDFSAYEIALMGRNPYLGRFSWPSPEDHEIVRRAMEQMHVLHLSGQPITTLSGSERQAVFLARALAGESKFLALDEPTSSLDLEHALQFLHLLRELAEQDGRGVLVVLHDLNWALRFCDTVALMNRGRMVDYGTPAKVLNSSAIREVFHVKAEAVSHGAQTVLLFEM